MKYVISLCWLCRLKFDASGCSIRHRIILLHATTQLVFFDMVPAIIGD